MVKSLWWIERTVDRPIEDVDRQIRQDAESQGFKLRPGAPIEYWRREGKSSVQISAEQFPGAEPIWLWEA